MHRGLHSPHPPPSTLLLRMEVVLTGSPVTKEQSAVIRAYLRTAQGLPENPSMLLTPDEEGLSPWALPLQHPPQRRAVPGKWPRALSPPGLCAGILYHCRLPLWTQCHSKPSLVLIMELPGVLPGLNPGAENPGAQYETDLRGSSPQTCGETTVITARQGPDGGTKYSLGA